MLKKIGLISLLFLSHLVIGMSVYCFIFWIGTHFVKSYSNNLSWGITLRVAVYLYISISLILSILSFLKISNRIIIIIYCMAFMFFALPLLGHICLTPYKTGLLLISALFGFLVPIFGLICIREKVLRLQI